MHSKPLIIILCTIWTLVAADIQKRSFAVERVKNPNFTGRDGPRTLVKTYRKFNMALPQGLLDAMEAREKKEQAAAAAAVAKKRRNTNSQFRYSHRRQAIRRGLLEDILNQLGLGKGNPNAGNGNNDKKGGGQNGDRGGNQIGDQGGSQNGGQGGNQDGGQAGNQSSNGDQGENENGCQAGNQNGDSEGNQNGDQGGNQNNGQGGNQSNNGGDGGGGTTGGGGGNGSSDEPSQTPYNSNKQVGSVPAVPEKNDIEFLSPVKIGGQTLNLDFDTGSSDLWVFNNHLDASFTVGHRVYNAYNSSTFKTIKGATFNISYGDGSGAEGVVGTDVVDVGGAKFDAQPVQLAKVVSRQFIQDQNNDGLMGLAFSSINTVKPQKQKTFFENVKDSLAEPVFTADLRSGVPGTYTFGAIDKSKFQGDLGWIPVNASQGFWQFSSERFAVNGGQPQPATSGGQAIADTGTTLILADTSIVTAYYSQVQGAQNNAQVGGFTFPCNAQLPDLALDVGNVYMAKVPGNDMNFTQVDSSTCFGGLQAAPQGQVGIYGDIFFKSQFVVFNAGNNSLGIAPHR